MDMERYIDLHTHSTASDGTMTPSELIEYAMEKNLAAIAITDHDTVEGVQQVIRNHAVNPYIEVIPGIEISVEYEGEMHILGYYIDVEHPLLNQTLERLREFRNRRNPKILEKLNQMGFSITLDEVAAKANGEIIGRPHIAAVMQEKGFVSSINEAFEKYLDVGKPAYVSRQRLTPREGIKLIKDAGGIAVLAHPVYLEKKGVEFEELLKRLIDDGLDGMECYYATYSKMEQDQYLALAAKYNLLVTGGSDFHGRNKPDIDLGTGYGDLKIPYYLLEKIKKGLGRD